MSMPASNWRMGRGGIIKLIRLTGFPHTSSPIMLRVSNLQQPRLFAVDFGFCIGKPSFQASARTRTTTLPSSSSLWLSESVTALARRGPKRFPLLAGAEPQFTDLRCLPRQRPRRTCCSWWRVPFAAPAGPTCSVRSRQTPSSCAAAAAAASSRTS